MTRTFIDQLDEMGEKAVRQRLVDGNWNLSKITQAERWLAEKDRVAAEESGRETARMARSANRAAWVAAVAAVVAVLVSAVALFW